MPSTDTSPSFAERLDAFVSDEQEALANLRRYFGVELPPGAQPFTGSRFEHLAGGGDGPGVADTVTAADLIAVQTLSVTVSVRVALDLLEGPLGAQLSVLLGAVPAHLDMAEADEVHLAPGSPADRAWHLLLRQDGVGWVTAGKLLARKRPRLLPVYDDVVRCAVGRPPSFWPALRSALRADGFALHRRLEGLRQDAGLAETVSVLRVCDVIVWMGHRTEHGRRT